MGPNSEATAPSTGHHAREEMTRKLDEEGAHDLADKLRACATTIAITCTNCGHHRRVEQRCKQRWCPVCAVKISMKRIARYTTAAGRCQWPLMVTLTIRNTEIAEHAANNIIRAFTKFRRTAFWKKTVKGGVASYECTRKAKGWHPHLHCLVDARWLAVNTPEPRHTDSTDTIRRKLRSAQRELSLQWAAALGQTEAIVHVRRAFGDHLKEALKYNLKPTELIESPVPIAPLLRALKGKRLVIPFGNFYDLGQAWKEADAEAKAACTCPECNLAGTYMPDAITETMRTREWSKHHTTGNGTRTPAGPRHEPYSLGRPPPQSYLPMPAE